MSETLMAKTAADMTFYAGKHAKHVPAGTVVLVGADAVESGRSAVYARVASNPRIAEVVYLSALVPA